jgi:hypothetical protein
MGLGADKNWMAIHSKPNTTLSPKAHRRMSRQGRRQLGVIELKNVIQRQPMQNGSLNQSL